LTRAAIAFTSAVNVIASSSGRPASRPFRIPASRCVLGGDHRIVVRGHWRRHQHYKRLDGRWAEKQVYIGPFVERPVSWRAARSSPALPQTRVHGARNVAQGGYRNVVPPCRLAPPSGLLLGQLHTKAHDRSVIGKCDHLIVRAESRDPRETAR
jgi:hypothetical protein